MFRVRNLAGVRVSLRVGCEVDRALSATLAVSSVFLHVVEDVTSQLLVPDACCLAFSPTVDSQPSGTISQKLTLSSTSHSWSCWFITATESN